MIRATPQLRRWSTYTVLGFVGYVVGALVVAILAAAHGLSLAERSVIQLVPPIALLTVVTLTRYRRGTERIVFYQVTAVALLGAMAVSALAGLRVLPVADHVATGIAIFLVFGRLGCFHVACCFGREARWGVRYGDAHIAHGLAPRFAHRTLLPVQLLESAASMVLGVACAAQLDAAPGTATGLFVTGYAIVRFVLELVRGDPGRALWNGLSEAQCIAVLSAIIVAAWSRDVPSIVAATVLVVAGAATARDRRAPCARLRTPQHVDEMARAQSALIAHGEGATRTTSSGLKLSLHVLPDMRFDLIWSHPLLRIEDAGAIAAQLYRRAELIPARSPGTVHVLVAAELVSGR